MRHLWKWDRILIVLVALLVLVTAAACNSNSDDTGEEEVPPFDGLTEEIMLDEWACYSYPALLNFTYDGKGLVDYDNYIPDYPQDEMFSYSIDEEDGQLFIGESADLESVSYNHVNDTLSVVFYDHPEPYEFVRVDAFVNDPNDIAGEYVSAEGCELSVDNSKLSLKINGELALDGASYELREDPAQVFSWEVAVLSDNVDLYYNVAGGYFLAFVDNEIYYLTKNA